MFPFNPIVVYHKDLGYSIPLDEIPEMIENATVTHFATEDNHKYNATVIAYCEGY